MKKKLPYFLSAISILIVIFVGYYNENDINKVCSNILVFGFIFYLVGLGINFYANELQQDLNEEENNDIIEPGSIKEDEQNKEK